MTALERFLTYITFETTSSETSGVRPSTPGQRTLTAALAEEMRALGLTDVHISEADGAAFGTVPATAAGRPALGLLAHVDTSPAASGRDVRARIVKNYDGGTIDLGDGAAMSPETNFADLRELVGDTKGLDDAALRARIREAAEAHGIHLVDSQVEQLARLCRAMEKLDRDALREKAEALGKQLEDLASPGGLRGLWQRVTGALRSAVRWIGDAVGRWFS